MQELEVKMQERGGIIAGFYDNNIIMWADLRNGSTLRIFRNHF